MKGARSVARAVPGGLFAGYAAKALWRHAVIDPYVTRRYRRRHAEAADVTARAAALDRDGYVLIRDFFDAETLAALVHECRAAAERVAEGGVDPADVQMAPHGSYRLYWRPAYGETVERRFFAHPFFAAVARFYLGGPVRVNYKIFQRSRPQENKAFFGAGEHFHFDYEFRTFKAFLYLNDVTAENGPLVYCPGTTQLSLDKLRKIARMHVQGTNQELTCSLGEARRLRLHERAVPLTGPAGTLLLADTRGYHKAGAIARDLRDVLVLYYGKA